MAVSPSDVEAFQKQAGALGVALSVVGVFEAVAGVKVFDQDGHEMSFSKTGWQHF